MKLNTPNILTHFLDSKENLFTRFGPFLRKFSFDELPQLINILKGDISFIGPRPALHNQEDLIRLRTEKNVHKLTPGITGWAQVNGRDELSIIEKVDLDHYHSKNRSTLLNVKILFLTIVKVLKVDEVKI